MNYDHKEHFHDADSLFRAINMKLVSQTITPEEVTLVNDNTGNTSYELRNYTIRMGNSLLIVHDYGIDEKLVINIT